MRQIVEDDLVDEALLKCPHAGMDKRSHARTLYTHARSASLQNWSGTLSVMKRAQKPQRRVREDCDERRSTSSTVKHSPYNIVVVITRYHAAIIRRIIIVRLRRTSFNGGLLVAAAIAERTQPFFILCTPKLNDRCVSIL